MDGFTEEELDQAEAEAEEHLEVLVARQFSSAQRLDRAAVLLTTIAWVELGIGVVGGLVAGIVVIVRDDALVGLAVILIVWVVAGLLFLPAYFTPAWARAFAAKSMAEAQRAWVRDP